VNQIFSLGIKNDFLNSNKILVLSLKIEHLKLNIEH